MSGDDSSLSLRAPARERVFRPFPLASPSGALYIERMFLLRPCINQSVHYLRLYRSLYSNKIHCTPPPLELVSQQHEASFSISAPIDSRNCGVSGWSSCGAPYLSCWSSAWLQGMPLVVRSVQTRLFWPEMKFPHFTFRSFFEGCNLSPMSVVFP